MIITALKSTVESLLADRVAPREVEGVEGVLHYHTSIAMIATIVLYIGYIVVGMHRLVSDATLG